MIIDPQKLIELVDLIKAKDAEIDRLRGVLDSVSFIAKANLRQASSNYESACQHEDSTGQQLANVRISLCNSILESIAARAALADGEGVGK